MKENGKSEKRGRKGQTLTHFSGLSTGEHNPCSVIPSWGKAQRDPGAPSAEYQWGCYYQLTHTHTPALWKKRDRHVESSLGDLFKLAIKKKKTPSSVMQTAHHNRRVIAAQLHLHFLLPLLFSLSSLIQTHIPMLNTGFCSLHVYLQSIYSISASPTVDSILDHSSSASKDVREK